MELGHTDGSSNLGQKTRPNNNQQQKKSNCKIVDFAVLADHRIKLVIYEAFCFDAAQGRMNGVPNETRTHSCRFASLAC